jgi:nuclear cap-binding protein subunit 2
MQIEQTRPDYLALPKHTPTASELLGANVNSQKIYWDRSNFDSAELQIAALAKSSTLYIGNLSFGTKTSHLYALFSQIGSVERVIMGLDRMKKTPCGFAFVEYRYRQDAETAIACLTGTKLDGRIIRVELDAGFVPGRQFGRGASGGQVRDDRKRQMASIDPERMPKRPKQQWKAPERA